MKLTFIIQAIISRRTSISLVLANFDEQKDLQLYRRQVLV